MNERQIYRNRFIRKWSNGRMQRSLEAIGWTLDEVVEMEMEIHGL